MKDRMQFALAIVLMLGAFALAQVKAQPHYGHDGIGILPDKALTPGAIRTRDTKAVCTQGAQQFRNTSAALKREVCAEYGYAPAQCPKYGKMEIDHLAPLTLGGADVKANLWVQLAPQYHWKDALEVRLHSMVCKNQISLNVAQEAIKTDWYAAYLKFVANAK